ncbi:MAG: site-specific DNA-methyltransferase [Minisyncoccia bacterium]
MKKPTANLLLGDCEKILSKVKDNSISLIVTSPPYTERRSDTYGGIKTDKYVEWFLPKSKEFLRVLKPTGTFILNIKEATENREKELYVLHLILELKKQGWYWTEEFIWHKKNSFPGKWPNRFRDSWERLLQFNKDPNFNMYQEAVMVPIGKWGDVRLKNLSEADKTRTKSKVGSGFGRMVANWTNRELVYPTNVLHIATETGNKNHSAVFPQAIPEWFIKLFTKKGDWVLDPFAGSATTLRVANKLGRNSIGIEVQKKYHKISKSNLKLDRATLITDTISQPVRRKTRLK